MLNELEDYLIHGGVKYLKENSLDNLEMGLKLLFKYIQEEEDILL